MRGEPINFTKMNVVLSLATLICIIIAANAKIAEDQDIYKKEMVKAFHELEDEQKSDPAGNVCLTKKCGANAYCNWATGECGCYRRFHMVDGKCVSRCPTCGTNTMCKQVGNEWKCACKWGTGDGALGCNGCKTSCDANATCAKDWLTKEYECRCKLGFAKVGAECIKTFCGYWQFSCCNGKCLDPKTRCDGNNNDCGDNDNSDEENCYQGPAKSCPPWHFQCANGKCVVSMARCNGKDECGDQSDERCCYNIHK